MPLLGAPELILEVKVEGRQRHLPLTHQPWSTVESCCTSSPCKTCRGQNISALLSGMCNFFLCNLSCSCIRRVNGAGSFVDITGIRPWWLLFHPQLVGSKFTPNHFCTW
uniref:Uncharacterized protein n=1 Tax=Cacopsylla melanoneura TaxID=428564 RepID=A0A8D8RP30_9HEMI